MPDISTYTEYGTTYDICDARNRSELEQIKEFIGYVDESRIAGLYVDYSNYELTRLAGAVGKSAGSDFDVFPMYGGRRLCNLADDGTVNAWYGEQGYTEDGSNGQVMVWQPKFYYKTVPVYKSKIPSSTITRYGQTYVTDPEGYYLYSANYYITDIPMDGFKIHPAFLAPDGVTELDGIYISAYEGSLYDVSANKYLLYDDLSDDGNFTPSTYITDPANDKMCSIAGVKPSSGNNRNHFGVTDIRSICHNRGQNWYSENFKVISMEQLLMLIEYASCDMQSALGTGVCWNLEVSDENCSVQTGATAFLGNGSGIANSTTRCIPSGVTNYTISDDGEECMSIRYRGRENDWCNMSQYIDGLNVYVDYTKLGGVPYYCDDYNYESSKSTGNYKTTGICLPYNSSFCYIDYFGWSEECDWAFIPTLANRAYTVSPIGDVLITETNPNERGHYRYLINGGSWRAQNQGGPFNGNWGGWVINNSGLESGGGESEGGRIMCLGPISNS